MSKARPVQFVDLPVKRAQVEEIPDAEQPNGDKVKQGSHPFPHIKPVGAEKAQKRQQQPGCRVIDGAGSEPPICLPVHRRDQEKVDQPADAKQAEGEEPNGASDRFAKIEPVGACKPKNPQQIANGLAVGIV